MPPHDDEIRIPLTVNTEIGDPLDRPLPYTNEVLTNRTPLYTAYTAPTVTYAPQTWTTNAININPNDLVFETNSPYDEVSRRIRFDLDHILDNYFRKIYRIILEHARIDISEEEFMKLIKEENDE